MTERATFPRRGSYGVDAPYAPAFLALLVVFYVVMALITGKRMSWLAALFISAIRFV